MLRRFDPTDSRHWINQGVEGAPRLIGSALQYGTDGFSFYEDPKLEANGLHRNCLIDLPGWQLVGLEAGQIVNLDRGGTRMFSVVEDAWPPPQPGRAREVAHCLIQLPQNTSNSMIGNWASKLARAVRVVPFQR